MFNLGEASIGLPQFLAGDPMTQTLPFEPLRVAANVPLPLGRPEDQLQQERAQLDIKRKTLGQAADHWTLLLSWWDMLWQTTGPCSHGGGEAPGGSTHASVTTDAEASFLERSTPQARGGNE